MTYKCIKLQNCRISNNPYEAVDDIYAVLGSKTPLIYYSTPFSLSYDIGLTYDKKLRQSMERMRDLARKFFYDGRLNLFQRREGGLVYHIAQATGR